MRVISKRPLRAFWSTRQTRAEAAAAERDLLKWHEMARRARWVNFAALKQTFGSADQVGNCVVFDVGNNRIRLIGRVSYKHGIVYVLKVMDHPEYDKGYWIREGGCDQPPPKRTTRPPRTEGQK